MRFVGWAALLCCCVAAAALASAGSPPPDPDWPFEQPELGNLYFVPTGAAYHHNPWECYTSSPGCVWPEDIENYEIYSSVMTRAPADPRGWLNPNHFERYYIDGTTTVKTEFAQSLTVVTRCLLPDSGERNLDCDHDPPSEVSGWWRYAARKNPRFGEPWQHDIHDERDRTVIVAVCLTDSDLAAVRQALEGLSPAAGGYVTISKDTAKGWDLDRAFGESTVKELFGRGWTDDGDPPRMPSRWTSEVFGGFSGTATWVYPYGGDGWRLRPYRAYQSGSGEDQVWTAAMTDEEAGSCWSDPVVVDDSVPWMAATVCQRASDFNLRVGNTDTYPWVDATGKPWYRALDHRSTPEATGLYRPLDWALLGFEEWEPLADAAVAAGLVWAVWPDDPDDPAYDSTGRSYADYGGKPVCILANG